MLKNKSKVGGVAMSDYSDYSDYSDFSDDYSVILALCLLCLFDVNVYSVHYIIEIK